MITDYVGHNVDAADVSTALSDAGVSVAGSSEVAAFGAMMFYGVALAAIFTAQNMLQGSYRGATTSSAAPVTVSPLDSLTVSGATSIRSLLAAGAGPDTVVSMEGGFDSTGRVSLAELEAPTEEEPVEEDESEEETEEEAESVDLSSMLKKDLVEMAQAAGMSTSGTKADLIARLS